MSVILMVAAALAASQCECGDGCGCSLHGPCRCVGTVADPPPLPTIDRAVAIADELRRPVVVWVGQRDEAIEAAVPEAIHAYAARITARDGVGVCVGVRSPGGGLSWWWTAGTARGAGVLRDALGLSAGPSAWPVSSGCSGGYYGTDGGCGVGGCGVGGCGVGGCGVGGCGVGSCGVGGRSGLLGRRR